MKQSGRIKKNDEDSSSRSRSSSEVEWIPNALFFTAALKPAIAIFLALSVGDHLRDNAFVPDGLPAIAPELASAVLLALAVCCRGESFLSRVWSWIILLASAGLANRAYRDAGVWSPEIEWLLVVPIACLVASGSFWALLGSWSPLLRTAAAGVAVALAPLPFLLFDAFVPHQAVFEATLVYGGFLLAAVCGCRMFRIMETEHEA